MPQSLTGAPPPSVTVPGVGQRRGGVAQFQITRTTIVHAAVVVIICAVLFAFALPLFNWLHRTLAAVLGLACYAVAVREVRVARSERRAPLLAVVAVFYFVFYGLAILWMDTVRTTRGPIFLGEDSITAAQLVVLLSFGAFVGGFRLLVRGGLRVASRLATVLPGAELSPGSFAVLVVWAALVVTNQFLMAMRVPLVPPQFEFMVSLFLSPYLLVGALAWAYCFNPGLLWGGLLAVSMILLVLCGLLSGMLEDVLRPVVVAGVALALVRNRIPWRLAVVAIVAFVVLQPAKFGYREEFFADARGRARSGTVAERLASWSRSIESVWTGSADRREDLRGPLSRTAELLFVAQAVDWVPERVPYTLGDHWLFAFSNWIPRWMWPEKPVPDIYKRYALEFDLQTAEGTRTSAMNVTQPADGYWAFGWPGVALGAFVFGSILGLLAGVCQWRTWAQFAMSCFWIGTVAPNNSTANFVAGLPQYLVGTIATIFLVGFAVQAFQSVSGVQRRPWTHL